MPFCFAERNYLGNLCRDPYEKFLGDYRNYFESWPASREEISFRDFLFFSSGGHFVHWSGSF